MLGGRVSSVLVVGLAVGVGAAAGRAHEGPHVPAKEQAAGGAQVRITERDGYRWIESNGLPDHATGAFPNRGNPNRIQSQRYRFRVTLRPQRAARITPVQRQLFGVAVNGIVFDPGTAEFWRGDPRSGWRYEAMSGRINLGLDDNHAHVQPSGAYHYHGIPTALLKERGGTTRGMVLLGYAADGFPIYGPEGYTDPDDAQSPLRRLRSSYRLKSGVRPDGPGGRYDGTFVADYEYVAGAGDLDECNGRTGVTPEYPDGTYYYVLTDAFPFVPRYFRGTPDASFDRQRPPNGPRGGGPPGRPGPPPGPRPFGPRS